MGSLKNCLWTEREMDFERPVLHLRRDLVAPPEPAPHPEDVHSHLKKKKIRRHEERA
jgi:hypothetical protein